MWIFSPGTPQTNRRGWFSQGGFLHFPDSEPRKLQPPRQLVLCVDFVIDHVIRGRILAHGSAATYLQANLTTIEKLGYLEAEKY